MGWSRKARGQGRVDGSAVTRRAKVCPPAPCLCFSISDLTLPPFSPDTGACAGRTQAHSRGQPKDTSRGRWQCRQWQYGLSAVAMLSRPQDAAVWWNKYYIRYDTVFFDNFDPSISNVHNLSLMAKSWSTLNSSSKKLSSIFQCLIFEGKPPEGHSIWLVGRIFKKANIRL